VLKWTENNSVELPDHRVVALRRPAGEDNLRRVFRADQLCHGLAGIFHRRPSLPAPSVQTVFVSAVGAQPREHGV
jgi:hypothetical protein